MLDTAKGAHKIEKKPIMKDKLITIEEFYEKTTDLSGKHSSSLRQSSKKLFF